MFCVVQMNSDQNTGPTVFGPFKNKEEALAAIRPLTKEFGREFPHRVDIRHYDWGSVEAYSAETWRVQPLEAV